MRAPLFHFHAGAKRAVRREAIQKSVQQVLQGSVLGPRARVMSLALRRFTIAEIGMNPVDQYLDDWLACEVLTGHNAKGNDHSKLAQTLALHLGRETKGGKRLVENGLRLHLLSTRGDDIVHGRKENVPSEDVTLLRQIASELVRKELGFKYVANKKLETARSRPQKTNNAAG